MKIIIIGGTGLISTAITTYLVNRGDEVIHYNRGQHLYQGLSPSQTIRGDRTRFTEFEVQMDDAGPFDCVIDMVCYEPTEAESAVRAFRGRTNQYIFCSTVDVYTKTGQTYPIREDADRRPDPVFPYAVGKQQCEDILMTAHDRGDFAVTMLRPAQTYGEGGQLVHTLGWGTYLYDRFRRGLPIIVHGDGTSLWAPCHRDDVADAFVSAVGNKAAYGNAYNVTGDEWLTWDSYYAGIAQAMEVPLPELIHIPTEVLKKVVPEPAHWCAINFKYSNIFDNSAAKQQLGFRYTTKWVEGARRTIQWMDEYDARQTAEEFGFYDQVIAEWNRIAQQLPTLST